MKQSLPSHLRRGKTANEQCRARKQVQQKRWLFVLFRAPPNASKTCRKRSGFFLLPPYGLGYFPSLRPTCHPVLQTGLVPVCLPASPFRTEAFPSWNKPDLPAQALKSQVQSPHGLVLGIILGFLLTLNKALGSFQKQEHSALSAIQIQSRSLILRGPKHESWSL